MRIRSIGILAALGAIALALLPTSQATATPLVAGNSYQFEIHANENHSNQTLDGIDLSFGSFAGSNVKNSSFVGATFVQTDFTNTNFQGANLSGADLSYATFSSGANLKNSTLVGANLAGVDLTGVNTQNVDFTGAYYNLDSVLPFDPVVEGMVVIPELSPLTLVSVGLLIFASMKPEGARLSLERHSTA